MIMTRPFLPWTIFLLTLLFTLNSCNKGGGSNDFIPADPPILTPTLILPSGVAATANSGTPYVFTVTLRDVSGTGTLNASFGGTTGTVSTTNLAIFFSSLNLIGTNLFSATGSVNGIFNGSGTVTVNVTYSEGSTQVSGSFVVTVNGGVLSTLVFSPSSPSTLSAGAPPLIITAIGSPSGGVYSSASSLDGGTGGSFSSINTSTGVFTFSGATSTGTASIVISYIPPDLTALSLTYTVFVNPAGTVPLLVCDTPGLAIIDNSSVIATMNVSGASTSLSDLNVFLDLEHSFCADLTVSLRSPSGTTINLTSGNGGSSANLYSTIILDDQAGTSVTTISLPDGTFSPEETLASFNGQNANGLWTLTLTDTALNDVGILNSWCLAFDGASIVPPTPTALSFLPQSPSSFVVGDPALSLRAIGSPSGGTYSTSSPTSGGTGGTFSSISSTTGIFSFSGATSAGTARLNVTYTPTMGPPLTLPYSVLVFASDPPPSLTFAPANPSLLTVGTPLVSFNGIGSPSGGTYSTSNLSAGGTGGTFSSIDPSTGVFSFSGTTSAGTARLDVTYTPVGSASSVTVRFSVIVQATPSPASLSFLPASPSFFVVGNPSLSLNAIGSPLGGTYSIGTTVSGGTGGSFSGINSTTGAFNFSGATNAGTATVAVTYTPPSGASVSLTYSVLVSTVTPPTTLIFSPSTPASFVVGNPSLSIIATGSPSGGLYTSGNISTGTTGGTFAGISPSTGVFSFSGATSAGTASISITYTPLSGSPLTLTYSVTVSAVTPPTALTFLPPSPSTILAGSPTLNITATAVPSGGLFSSSNSLSGGTGGTFSTISPSTGAFSFSGATSAGTASVSITYTPLSGSPLTLTYTVVVSTVNPPSALTFLPLSPATTVLGDPPLTISAIGFPPGGSYSKGANQPGTTGASFSSISTTTGTFTFSGATAAGSASTSITYTPTSGSPVTQTYTVLVSPFAIPASLSFLPTSPASLSVGSPPLAILALGTPSGGVYSSSSASAGTTGGAFSSISPSVGSFAFSGTTASGTASILITYTPPSGSPVSATYTITVALAPVSTLTFSPPPPASFTVGNSALTITAIGSPAGGLYSSGSTTPGGTGGSFSPIAPTTGTFTFSSASSAGTASIPITYIPTTGSPVVATYSVVVTLPALTPLLLCDSPSLLVADVTTTTSSLLVSNGPTSIFDLNVFFDLSHTFTGDLDIFLNSPQGTRIELTTDNGGSSPDLYTGLVLDDDAPTSITTISAPRGYFCS
jgi:subtilisin-like proprotein convertase family protein